MTRANSLVKQSVADLKLVITEIKRSSGPSMAPSEEAITTYNKCWSRVIGFSAAEKVWNELLSNAERRRVGGDLDSALVANDDTIGIWKKVKGSSGRFAVIQIAFAIGFVTLHQRDWLLREFQLSSNLFDAAIRSGGLVVMERPAVAYWKSEEVLLRKKGAAPGRFLFQLAKCSKMGIPLNDDNWDDETSQNYFGNLKHQLIRKNSFPADLAKRIKPVESDQYIIDLPADQIRIFERDGQGNEREWFPPS